jgi:hypothetical protein
MTEPHSLRSVSDYLKHVTAGKRLFLTVPRFDRRFPLLDYLFSDMGCGGRRTKGHFSIASFEAFDPVSPQKGFSIASLEAF